MWRQKINVLGGRGKLTENGTNFHTGLLANQNVFVVSWPPCSTAPDLGGQEQKF